MGRIIRLGLSVTFIILYNIPHECEFVKKYVEKPLRSTRPVLATRATGSRVAFRKGADALICASVGTLGRRGRTAFDELRALMTGVLVLQAVQRATMIAIALALNMR